jgi:hypothetical protein
MKIALCISGYMRTFKHTFACLNEHLLSQYPEIDTFIHTWQNTDYWTNAALDIEEVKNLYHPKKIIIENQFSLPIAPIMISKNPEKLRNINNVLSMFYKIKKCNDLKSEYEQENNFKYNCVIRFRADIKLHAPIILEHLSDISIPKFGDFGGLNDQFAFSNSENMDFYSSLYDKIAHYLTTDETNYLCMKPELFTKYHINKKFSESNIQRPHIPYILLKRENEILDNEKREREFGYIK